jgi:hypothetical protein
MTVSDNQSSHRRSVSIEVGSTITSSARLDIRTRQHAPNKIWVCCIDSGVDNCDDDPGSLAIAMRLSNSQKP